ncbi:MAG: site-specific integrase [Motiliproteus sp.]|nr:site-specific integrase [Motiliproteus sp.]MCW9052578.1 site-specific integrase [Motiliproteus sp.]
MAKVRARKETGTLFIDFRYMNIRFREQTALLDTPANRRKVDKLVEMMEAKMLLNQFDYAEFFPNSPNLAKIGVRTEAKATYLQAAVGAPQEALPTFGEFSDQWFEENNVGWRRSHIRNVESLLNGSLKKQFGNKRLNEISKADLMAYRTAQCKRPGRGGNEGLSPKTVNNRMGILRMIFEEAADRFSFENPYRNIKPLKLQRIHIEPFSLVEVNRVLDTVRPDYRNYYTVRFYSGMRTGEIDGLRWEYVDFERRQILVRETLVGGHVEYTKTDGSQREIPMLGPVYDALKAQYEATGKLSRYVFCNSEGEPLDQNNVTKRVWYPLLRHLGMKKRRPYQTRHTAATLFLASGENPEWVARVLGHSSTEMLFKVYSRYIPNLTRQDGSAFESLVKTDNDENDNRNEGSTDERS